MTDPNAPTTEQLEVKEQGLDRPADPLPGIAPPGGGKWPVPHHFQFVGLINQFARAYRWSFDEALKNCPDAAIAMRNDPVLLEALRERQMMTAQLGWHLEPRDETDQAQVDAAAKLERVIRLTPNLQKFFMLLLEGIWYGRFGVMVKYDWDKYDPSLMLVNDFRPINGDSLVARWGGDWGLLVHGQSAVTWEPYERAPVHWLTDEERSVTIIHTHEPEAADYRDPQLAGGVKGVGVRGRLYWYWWYKSNFLALLGDYAERFANGIWIAYYDQNNPTGKDQMEASVAGYKANRVINIPRTEQGETPYGLEIREVGSASSSLLTHLIDYFDAVLRRFILGLAMADGMDVGVGGDGADLLTSKVSRTVKYDAQNLAETLSQQWVPLLAKYNTPGIPPPRFVFDVDRPAADRVLDYAERIAALGGDVPLDHIYEITGIPKPSPGDAVASKVQPLSPTAMNNTPQGVPVATTPGSPAQPQSVTVPAQVSTSGNNVLDGNGGSV